MLGTVLVAASSRNNTEIRKLVLTFPFISRFRVRDLIQLPPRARARLPHAATRDFDRRANLHEQSSVVLSSPRCFPPCTLLRESAGDVARESSVALRAGSREFYRRIGQEGPRIRDRRRLNWNERRRWMAGRTTVLWRCERDRETGARRGKGARWIERIEEKWPGDSFRRDKWQVALEVDPDNPEPRGKSGKAAFSSRRSVRRRFSSRRSFAPSPAMFSVSAHRRERICIGPGFSSLSRFAIKWLLI